MTKDALSDSTQPARGLSVRDMLERPRRGQRLVSLHDQRHLLPPFHDVLG